MGIATTLTTSTTICFKRDPTHTLEAKSEWQLPLLPQLLSVFIETPPPLVKLNMYRNYPHYPNSQLTSVLKETPSPLCDYFLHMVYNMGIDSH